MPPTFENRIYSLDELENMTDTEYRLWQQQVSYWPVEWRIQQERALQEQGQQRENDLRPNQFTYWKMKFKSQALVPEFVQVPSTQISQALSLSEQKGLTLNTDNGFQIEIPDGFSQTTLVQVLDVLRRC